MPDITTTPWGKPDTQTVIAEGIIAVTTPSHGGIWLSPERLAEMPEHLRKCSFTRDNWFEEDAAWCAVALAWPEFFPIEQDDAAAMYKRIYAARREGVEAKARNEPAPAV